MSSTDEITLVRGENWEEYKILYLNQDQGDKAVVMHIFDVDGVKVLLYSYYHSASADLVTWVTVPENFSKIRLTLCIPATTSNNVDCIETGGDVPPVEALSSLTDSVNIDDVPPTGGASLGSMPGGKLADGLSLTDYSDDVQTTISKETV